MNKTEPVRASAELWDFGSSDLGKFGTDKLTNFDRIRSNESFAAGLWNFQTPALTDAQCSAIPNSDTSAIHEGVSS